MKNVGLVLAFVCLSTNVMASDGGVTSNGGDSVAAEFTNIGRHVAEIIRTQINFPVSADQFLRAVSGTLVTSKNHTILRGNEVDAINYPTQRRIEVNRKRWLNNKDLTRSHYVLVAHEYFGILGVDDSRYQVSEKLFGIPGASRHTIRCKAFEDNALGAGSKYFLEINDYEQKAMAVVKDTNGKISPLSYIGVGDTIIKWFT